MKGMPAESILYLGTLFAVILGMLPITSHGPDVRERGDGGIHLPPPKYDGEVSVEEALLGRRSVREFRDEALRLAEVSQLLWAAQGISSPRGYRTAPSAGALYPLEVYLVAGKVEGLPPGVYRYKPHEHGLAKSVDGDKRSELSSAALSQGSVRNAPILILFSAVFERTTGKYRERGVQYVHMEAGHAAQNVCLQAVSLGLGTVIIGAFRDGDVKKAAGMPDGEKPLLIVPVGEAAARG